MRSALLERPAAAMVSTALLVLACRAPASEPASEPVAPITQSPKENAEAPPPLEDGGPCAQGGGSEAPAPDPSSLLALSDVQGGARIDRVETSLLGGELLEPGDVVVEADGRRIHGADELRRHLTSLGPGTALLLVVRRGGRTRFVGVQLPGSPPRREPPPAPAAAAAPPQRPEPLVVVVQGGGAPVPMPATPFIGGGGGTEVLVGPQPPSYSAPGLPRVPGATFAPGPATPAQAVPQIGGISQPPGFLTNPLPGGIANQQGQGGPGVPSPLVAPGAPGIAGSPVTPASPPPNAAGGQAAPPMGGAFNPVPPAGGAAQPPTGAPRGAQAPAGGAAVLPPVLPPSRAR